MTTIQDTLISRAADLLKTRKLRMGVTNIIRLVTQCPRLALFYSKISPYEVSQSLALASGSLLHAFGKVYYDCDVTTPMEHVLELAIEEMKRDHYFDASRMQFYYANQDKINATALKYFQQFRAWAKQQSKPWLRECLFHSGMRVNDDGFVEGIIDRFDRYAINGEYYYRILDYKTTSSIPLAQCTKCAAKYSPSYTKCPTCGGYSNIPELYQGYLTQMGGYMWLLNYIHPDLYQLDHFYPPQIVFFRQASWECHTVSNWQLHYADFKGILKTAVNLIYALVHGNVPEKTKNGKICYWCLVKDRCLELEQT